MTGATGRCRLGVLISGRGSNMLALVRAAADLRLEADVGVVISNVAEAAGLREADKLGLPALAVPHAGLTREEHERRVAEALAAHGVTLVCLAGYMRLLSPWLVARYRGALLNVHPSLLPAFPGKDAQRQALAHGVRVSGCTVHFVDEGLDSGPILVQQAVPVLDGDDEAALSARILEAEHRAYPEAAQLVATGRVRLDGRRVVRLTS